MSKSKILFQLTGSIACFKACQAISKLVQAGHDVQVEATASALQFVGNATIEGLTGKPVISDLYATGNVMDHIHLVRWADLIIVAPASANFINKIAQGVGDDLLTTQFLAHDFKKPYLIAPAMNTSMYLHPVTQASIQKLKQMGVEILETASGVLACGEVGWGRLIEPDLLVQEVQSRLEKAVEPKSETAFENISLRPAKLKAKVLVTSGGTQEPLDPVRVITNKSTGTTGAAIADTLVGFGFDVTYVHAESAKLPQSQCHKAAFTSFQDLQETLQTLLQDPDYKAVIHLAAVSDYSPAKVSDQKISSDESEMVLKLKRNPKLVDMFREMAKNPDLKVIAFKLTAGADLSHQKAAVDKLMAHSQANLIVQNDMSEMGVVHPFHIYDSKGKRQDLMGKEELGSYLSEYLTEEIL
jgi:phosphopantothenoylcysteine decarboxylase/phosphopantothenate--cysteine ligase